MEHVTQLRQQFNIGRSRNVAYALEDITSRGVTELYAASAENTPKNFQVPVSRRFITKVVDYDRYWDSEVMILEYIASKASPSESGTVKLFSERTICPSCLGVIEQFGKTFPNITVYYNSGP
jgi:archaellum biogenesis ATPase FlaH